MKIINGVIILLFIGSLILAIIALYNKLISHDSDNTKFYAIISILSLSLSFVLASVEGSDKDE
jgi:TM2 domain-containing membrane protein YozV